MSKPAKFGSKDVFQSAIRTVFFTFSLLGLPVIFVPLLLYLLWFEPSLALKTSMIVAANELVCGAIKLIYKKERPVPMPAKNLFQLYNAGGFPSIHTARITVFAAITGLLSKNPTIIAAGIFLIAAVASSRVYLKKHDWIDVLGGFAIGALISAAAMAKGLIA